MKLKRVVKRILAVGAGATMLGATVMGAMAADLSNYPDQFVTDGVFNGYLVVGEKAAAIDNLALTDIASSMKYLKAGASSAVTVEGDAWRVGTSAKFLELANNNASETAISGEQISDINTFIGDTDLAALSDGTWSTNEQDYDYHQFLFFDDVGFDTASPSSIVKYAENDDEVTADFFYIGNGKQIARFKLEFTSTAQSDVTDSAGSADSTGLYLDDFDSTEFSLMGSTYSVVQARRLTTGGESVKLTLMAGSTKDTLFEGESKTYTIGDKTYDVSLTYVDETYAKFTVNGEATNKLQDGETYVLSDKSEVGVSEVLYQSYAGGIHSATFYLGAKKVELKDDNITNASNNGYNLIVGSEDIDGTTVIVTGTDNDVTLRISTIEVNMTAEDDFFVPSSGKLSEVVVAADEEEEVLMAGGFDVEYKGLTTEKTEEIKLASSGTRRYQLSLFDGDGNKVDLPVAYAEAQYNLTVGEASSATARSQLNNKRLIWNETTAAAINAGIQSNVSTVGGVYKNDYFIVTGGTAADGSAKSYLLQYKGADASTKTSPKMKFKNLGSGETLEYSVTAVTTTDTVCTIKLGGYSFLVHNATAVSADDFAVAPDMNGGGAVADATINFVDYYGSQWAFSTVGSNESNGTAENQQFLTITQTTPNADDYDNWHPTGVILNITSTSGPEVRAAMRTATSDMSLLAPEGVTETTYGYTSMGTFVTLNSPSSDPQQLTMEYPEKQRLPQLFITSGATTSATSGDGSLTAVTIVDATKLDSEIASVSAQNLIVVGGPCVNTVAAELLGNPADCAEGFTPGKARVKLFEQANGNVAMLVAGYSGQDTRLAGKVVSHRASELSGTEVVIEGTTYSDATISKPSATPVVEEVAAEETVTE